MVIWSTKNAFREHSNCSRNASVADWDWQANAFKRSLEHKNAFREHSNCTQNAFVSETDWQANAFKWSFGSIKVHVVSIQTVPEMHLLLSRVGISMVIWSTKVHFVSIPTVPEMHLFLSRIGKHMHSNGHLEHQKCIS